jgi:hypothetical protein
MELWSLCYLPTRRPGSVLASQAEWQTRLLPALAGQMHLETTRCQHAQPASGLRQPLAIRPGGQQAPHPGYPRPSAAS